MRFIKMTSVLVLMAALFVGQSHGAESESEESAVVRLVEAKYSKVDVLKAAFVQTVKTEAWGEEVQRGEMVLKRPAKMLWEFSSTGKKFVTNGSTMWIYVKKENQVIRYKDVSATGSTADSLLQSLDKLESLFEVKIVPAPGPGRVLSLLPKNGDISFKRVRLTLDADNVIKEVVIVDAVNTVTTLQFSAVELNKVVPDSKFEFQIPDGAKVIDAGG